MTPEQLAIEHNCQKLTVLAVDAFTKAIKSVNAASVTVHINRLAWLDYVTANIPGKAAWDARIALAQLNTPGALK